MGYRVKQSPTVISFTLHVSYYDSTSTRYHSSRSPIMRLPQLHVVLCISASMAVEPKRICPVPTCTSGLDPALKTASGVGLPPWLDLQVYNSLIYTLEAIVTEFSQLRCLRAECSIYGRLARASVVPSPTPTLMRLRRKNLMGMWSCIWISRSVRSR